jgi:WD repeat-containing protein 35
MSFHVYLSTRLPAPSEKSVSIVAWNRVNNLVACGQSHGVISLIRVSFNSDRPGDFKLEIIFSLVDHKQSITALIWNERFNRLISGDSSGTVVVWVENAGKWRPNHVHALSQLPVTSLSCSHKSDVMAITYSDGRVICGDIHGMKRWELSAGCGLIGSTWHAGTRTAYLAGGNCRLFQISARGELLTVDLSKVNVKTENNAIVGAQWHSSGDVLLIAYQSGHVAILCGDADESPSVVDCECTITALSWSNSGTQFAVTGVVAAGECRLRFYSSAGKPLRSLTIAAQNVTSLSFNHSDDQLILGIDNYVALVQVVSDNPWAYVDGTIVYSIPDESLGFQIVFFNCATGEAHTKTLSGLCSIAAGHDSVMLASEDGEFGALMICSRTGVPGNVAFIPFKPEFTALTRGFAIAVTGEKLALWTPPSSDVKYVRLKNRASAIAARDSSLFIAFASHELVIYSLPQLEETARYAIAPIIDSIALSSDLTRVSLIDIYGNMSFLDVHSGALSQQPRRETWWMRWAEDSPDLLVTVERQRIYVYRKFVPEEPIPSLAQICAFKGLIITVVDFIGLSRHPLRPNVRDIHTYESKSLRDLRSLLTCEGVSADELLAFVREKSHPRLWQMLAEWHLASMNLSAAERCFIEAQIAPGLALMRRLATLPRGDTKRGYVLWFLRRFAEAEPFLDPETAALMHASVGNWERAAELSSPHDDMYVNAHTALANDAYVRGDWLSAARECALARDPVRQLRALSRANDLPAIGQLMERLPEGHALLASIGTKFMACGAAERAVAAFLKLGDAQRAVDACAHLNRWQLVVELAREHPEVGEQSVMARYAAHLAGNSRLSEALQVQRQFGLLREAAALLDKEGELAFRHTRKYVHAKKCFVFSAQMLEEHGSKDPAGKGLANGAWRKAEAVHFFLLAHRQAFSGQWEEALGTAVRVSGVYGDFVGKEAAASLLALCGFQSRYFKQCSDGFIYLENTERLSKRKREKIGKTAVRIFGKFPPKDPPDLPSVPCKRCQKPIIAPRVQCSCGYVTVPSIVSGAGIHGGKAWRCPGCRHYALQSELPGLEVCPLCHSRISGV